MKKLNRIIQQAFEIHLFQTNSSLLDRKKYAHIKQIADSKFLFSLNPINTQADPFLFVFKGQLFLFYEEKHLYGKGYLRMIKSRNLKDWTPPVTVLKEKFHLSFPFVFEDDGQIYMIPETNENNCISIYEAETESLTSFKLKKQILKCYPKNNISLSFVDSSLIKKDGFYYLVTTIKENDVYTLKLFYSESLWEDWHEHPMSPLCKSNKYARNGGALRSYKNEIYRISQNCDQGYGDNLTIHKITELSPTSYKEEILIDDFLEDKSFFSEGGHQLDFVKFNDLLIVATDCKVSHNYFLQKICHKLHLIFSSL